MSVLDAPPAALAWLGRQGTRAIAALVFIGIAVPPIDAALKPFVTEAIFVLLCIAFLRVDPAALRGYLGRPALVLWATAWTMLMIPALFGALGRSFQGREADMAELPTSQDAHEFIAALDEVDLARFCVVGTYTRHDEVVRNALQDARQKILAGSESPGRRRENHLIWAQSYKLTIFSALRRPKDASACKLQSLRASA
jgi:hypothetical protein